MDKLIRSAYDGLRTPVKVGGGETMVRKQFQEEADINNILDRYATTGLMPLNNRPPIFADVSIMQDLKTSMDTLAALDGRLGELPREARELFQEDPAAFATKLADPLTKELLQELKVLAPDPVEPVVPPVVAPAAPDVPEVIPPV